MNLSEKTEGEVYEEILDRLLSHSALDGFDKRQTGVSYHMLAPVAAELANAYIQLYRLTENAYVDTADPDSLILRAKELGLEYREATACVIRAQIDSDEPVQIGERFAVGSLVFSVSASGEDDVYELVCETSGAEGNAVSGSMVYLGYGSGIHSAEMIDIKTYGREAETADELRTRYYERVHAAPFAGNKAAYRQAVMELDGVGGCKIERAQTAGDANNVTVTVMSSDYDVLDYDALESIQNAIDPTSDRSGDGFAPIGHAVFVRSVVREYIKFNLTAEYENGYHFESVQSALVAAAEKVAKDVCRDWAKNGSGTLRLSAVFSEMLKVEGVKDITELTMEDGDENVCRSVTFDGIVIPKVGSVVSV